MNSIQTRNVNEKALVVDYETYSRAQKTLNTFQTGKLGGIDIKQNPIEWQTAVDLGRMRASWLAAGRLSR